MLKFSKVAVAFSFVLGVAAGCSPGRATGTTTGTVLCSPACGTNQVCDPTTNTCSCYTGYHPCSTDADAGAGTAGDGGSVADGGAQSFVCANFALDNDNCGTCGNVCPVGEGCLGAQCVCHLTDCTDDAGTTVCTDPESDPNNCGGCGNKCPTGEQCTLGICTCVPTLTIASCDTDAGPQCVNLTTDNSNCGGCGVQCAGNQHCAAPGGGAGVCVCDTGAPGTDIQNCGGSCTDTTQDPFNCGECGVVCVSGSCSAGPDGGGGACNCPPPYTQCGPDCVDTFSDINHCGDCNNDCTIQGQDLPELACNLGQCFCGPTSQGTICQGPVAVCATTSTDAQNCGGCGSQDPKFICTPPATECVNSTCTCPDGLSLCGNPDAGQPLFCTDTTQRVENCGTCGNICSDTYAAGSGCRFGICTCSPGQSTLCTDLPANPVDPTCTCVTDNGSASPCSAPSFATDVYPLLAQESGTFGCAASGCHSGGAPAAGLAFLDSSGHQDAGMAYAELLGTGGGGGSDAGVPFCDAGVPSNEPSKICACVSLVTPGSINQSYLDDVLTKDLPCSAGAPMPEDADGGWLPLSACSRQLIEQWITSGAGL